MDTAKHFLTGWLLIMGMAAWFGGAVALGVAAVVNDGELGRRWSTRKRIAAGVGAVALFACGPAFGFIR